MKSWLQTCKAGNKGVRGIMPISRTNLANAQPVEPIDHQWLALICVLEHEQTVQSRGLYPNVPPVAHISGMKPKASAMLVSSVISAITFLVTPIPTVRFLFHKQEKDAPIFPLHAPCMPLLMTSNQYDFDKPKADMAMLKPTSPNSRTGLRPIRSESLPHATAVTLSLAKKIDS